MYATSRVPVLHHVFCTLFLVFLPVAIPHLSLLLPGKAAVAGEVADAVLGMVEQVSPTDDGFPGGYSFSMSACGVMGYATCPHSQKYA